MSEPDNPLFAELQAVHELIRADLARVTLLADATAGGAASAEVRARLGELKSSTILWQLRYGCLRHCRFVHSHHGLEDRALFPGLRSREPELGPVLDKLEADHRTVSALLDGVEEATAKLDREAGSAASRARLTGALAALAEALLEHLDYEERSLEPTLGRLRSWPL